MSDLRVDYFKMRFKKSLFILCLDIIKQSLIDESSSETKLTDNIDILESIENASLEFHIDARINTLIVSSDEEIIGATLFEYNYATNRVVLIGDSVSDKQLSIIMKGLLEKCDRS